ncbi:MAG: hypothetical protein HYU66_15265, partial [Armatimonadetes bacterium]|nr:hypothetical protein [Armatimonadota bacterium]
EPPADGLLEPVGAEQQAGLAEVVERPAVAAVGGRDAQVWYVAPTFRLADLHWRGLRRCLPRPFPGRVVQSDRRIVLDNGAEITFRSADNPDHLRGAGLDFLVVDEAAFIPDAGTVWAEALRPTLSDRLGRALIISTPRGRDWFWQIWQRGQDGLDPEIQSFWFPTATNPLIRPSEVEAARRELPERIFRQEYEAAFLDDGGSVFRRVAEAARAVAVEPYEGHFVIGVDWAKRQDFTVLVVLDAERQTVVEVDRFNQIDYALQTQRLNALCARWRPRVVLAEQNSIGEPLLEQLRRDGLPVEGFKTTAASKARVIDQLSLAFEQGALSLPRDPVLVAELEAYTMEPARDGHYKYGAPPGMHDDCVMALALAWEARGRRSPAPAAYFV